MNKLKKTLSVILCVLMLLPFATPLSAAQEKAYPESDIFFDDVENGKWYTDSIMFCAVNGFMNGVGEYSFSKDTVLTRAQFAVILSVISKADLEGYTDIPFTDVQSGTWYTKAVCWLAENGITTGTGNGCFSPSGKITREQLCTFLLKYAAYAELDTEKKGDLTPYTDMSKASGWAIAGIEYAVGAGLLNGVSATSFSPKTFVTRAQMSVVVKNFILNHILGDHEHNFSDASCTEASKCSVCDIKLTPAKGHDKSVCCTGGLCPDCEQNVSSAGHCIRNKVVQPTCTEDGGEYDICRRCGYENCRILYNALGHTTTLGICQRCKAEIYDKNDGFQVVKFHLLNKAPNWDADLGNYYMKEYEFKDGSYASLIISIKGYGQPTFSFVYFPYYDENSVFALGFEKSGKNADEKFALEMINSSNDLYYEFELVKTQGGLPNFANIDAKDYCMQYVNDMKQTVWNLYPIMLDCLDDFLKETFNLTNNDIGIKNVF